MIGLGIDLEERVNLKVIKITNQGIGIAVRVTITILLGEMNASGVKHQKVNPQMITVMKKKVTDITSQKGYEGTVVL